MTQETVVSIEARGTPESVFDYWSDVTNNPTWQRGMKKCVWTSDGPVGVGSTYDQHAEMFGRPIVSSFEVVEYEPGAKIRYKTTVSTFPLDITREVASIGDDMVMLKATIRGEPSGVFKLMGPITRKMLEKNVNRDYAQLKGILDGRAR